MKVQQAILPPSRSMGLLHCQKLRFTRVSRVSKLRFGIGLANNRLVLLLLFIIIVIQCRTGPASNVGRKHNLPKLSKTYIICWQIAPRCLPWTKLRNQNKMQSEKYDYSQLNSMSIYGHRCKTLQCPHLSSQFCISSTSINLIRMLICRRFQSGRLQNHIQHLGASKTYLNMLWADKQYQHQQQN